MLWLLINPLYYELPTNMDVTTAISHNLNTAIEAQQKTLAEISDATSISGEMLASYRYGQELPSLIDFIKLYQFLGIKPEALLDGLPSLLNYASSAPAALSLNEGELEELQANFFKVKGPNRGDKFKNFIKQMTDLD